MKKIAIALGITIMAVAMPLQAMAAPPPGGAGSDVIVKGTGGGPFAIAIWEDPTTNTTGVAYADGEEDYLVLSVETTNYDAEGNITGWDFTYVESSISAYGSLKVDKQLATATISVTDVPATMCEFDADFFGVCERDVPIDAQVTFTGVGRIDRKPNIFHGGHGDPYIAHEAGPSRQATASGTIGGTAFTDSQVISACEDDYVIGFTLCGFISLQYSGFVFHASPPGRTTT